MLTDDEIAERLYAAGVPRGRNTHEAYRLGWEAATKRAAEVSQHNGAWSNAALVVDAIANGGAAKLALAVHGFKSDEDWALAMKAELEVLLEARRYRASDDCEFCELDGAGNHAPRCPEFLENKLSGLKPEHSCVAIARAPHMSAGRDWWIGKLTAPVPEWPKETHCLHMKTPLKDVVFLCNRGDFEALATLSACYFGHPVNESWVSSVMQHAIARAGKDRAC